MLFRRHCHSVQQAYEAALPRCCSCPQVLDTLQKVFFRSNPAREAFVELCEDPYVQKMTFDSYLYKVRQSVAQRGRACVCGQIGFFSSSVMGAAARMGGCSME